MGHGVRSPLFTFFISQKITCSALNGRISNSNYDSGPNDDEVNMVSDTQFRYRLINHLEVLVEFRFKEFLPANQEHGFGIGLKYSF